ncbi:unnamed protein product [Cyprideis torosa]|uniref:ubiquitinyl hydrolase 1 n=1 Tax=Cyprideis torosa TaxID=163714 RepID=A0A7R8WH36_9CRUS|nr:unnamed protein product [Cyprideis torosa]CAG0892429.1 unnamed protein product [Cyprideis torosa]
MSRNCDHTKSSSLGRFVPEKLQYSNELKCAWCPKKGPNLWLCLHEDCFELSCGKKAGDHSGVHYRDNITHCLQMNISTKRIWCHSCTMEVFLEQSSTMESIPSGKSSSTDTTSTFDDSEEKPIVRRGLAGLQNLGNTCYMNGALQALSNTPPLRQFFLDCGSSIAEEERPALAFQFQILMREMWGSHQVSCISPTSLFHRVKMINPAFRGFQQQDTQEFLRCFLDALHEELKERTRIVDGQKNRNAVDSGEGAGGDGGGSECSDDGSSDDETESNQDLISLDDQEDLGGFETADSGVSGDEDGVHPHPMLSEPPQGNRPRRKRKRRQGDGDQLRQNRLSSPRTVKPHQPSKKRHQSNAEQKEHSNKKKENFKSIISEVFDGKILSTVQCLTCQQVSTTREIFQDLSLPIPSRDQVALIRSQTQAAIAGQLASQSTHVPSCSDGQRGSWFYWLLEWLKPWTWFWGHSVSLMDCLSAFFSADELKGDNMYSCEKCHKLRNGVKLCRMLELPEVLCIHLKRFRHDFVLSSKILTPVSFPLEGLDLSSFCDRDCPSRVTTYDLIGVICHHGGVGGGHYTAFCYNDVSRTWFEYDDRFVTEVSPELVATSEAYVLFYRYNFKESFDVLLMFGRLLNLIRRKSNSSMIRHRSRVMDLAEREEIEQEPFLKFYISRRWLNRFNTFAEPGPIDNSDFLCPHGGLSEKTVPARNMILEVSQTVWEYLHSTFGGGPPCNRLFDCQICDEELRRLKERRDTEYDEYHKRYKELQNADGGTVALYAISLPWFKSWENFLRGKEPEPPGPIDNTSIVTVRNAQNTLRAGSDYCQIPASVWEYLLETYGGGPPLLVRPGSRPLGAAYVERIPATISLAGGGRMEGGEAAAGGGRMEGGEAAAGGGRMEGGEAAAGGGRMEGGEAAAGGGRMDEEEAAVRMEEAEPMETQEDEEFQEDDFDEDKNMEEGSDREGEQDESPPFQENTLILNVPPPVDLPDTNCPPCLEKIEELHS